MDWTTRVRLTFANASHQPDEGVIEELAQHVGALYEAARADGCSHDEAERRVADHLERWRGDAARLRHRSRHVPVVVPPPATSGSRWAGLAQDLRYAVRLLRRQPRHALLTILTMALGIGATTVLFSVTYGVLMKPLPWPNANRIVVLKETRGGSAPRFGEFTNAAYLAWRGEPSTDQPSTIEHIAAWSQRLVTLSGAGESERIRVTAATASVFPALGAQPLLGTFFEPKDEAAQVVVPLEQRLLTTLARPRLYAMLLGGFATFALVVAVVGLFGLLSYSVSLRSREIAIRTALGARRADILRLVLRQGLGVTLGGVAAGMLASAWLSEAVSTQLYGVTTHDAPTFVLVPVLLVAVGMLACLLPARRAATQDSQRILRGG